MSFVVDPDAEQVDPYYQRINASELKDACKFTSGSLWCVNDPCPNPNHHTPRRYLQDGS